MSRIRKILDAEKKVGTNQIEATKGESDQLIINAIDILNENEQLYNIGVLELKKEDNHTRTMEILNYFIENDLYLRRIIAKKERNPYELSLKVIIELQSYYNFFRITLLSEVVNYLVLSYNQVKKHLKDDYNLAFEWYKYAETVNEIYIHNLNMILKKGANEADEHQKKIYGEVVDAFEEVKKIGIQAIQILMRQSIANVTKPGKMRL